MHLTKVPEPVEGPSVNAPNHGHSARQKNLYEKWFRQAQPPSRSAVIEPVKRIFIKNGFDRLNHRVEVPLLKLVAESIKRIFIKNGFDRLNHRREMICE